MSIRNLISRAKNIFRDPQDQEKLQALENIASDSDSIQIAMDSEGGRILKKQLVDDFFTALDNLFKTNDQQYIADLKSIKKLLDKLSSNQGISSIKAYLEDKLKEYE